jgi:RNA polymerase sigma factor (sigma-70 family)
MFLRMGRSKHSGQEEPILPDEALIELFLETGNKEVIGILFERYTHLVYGICLRYLKDRDQCKDAVMEIFENLFDKLSGNRISSFKNWIYTVSRNHCLMMIRKSAGAQRIKNRIIFDTVDAEVFAVDLPAGDKEKLVAEAIEHLISEQRLCVSLLYLQDKSYKDISDLTGYTLNQVKSHVQNGKRNLKNYLLSRYDTF